MEQKVKYNSTIGENMRRLRRAKDYTQEYVARKLQLMGIDVSISYYSKIERSELHINPVILVALAKIFECEINDFFVGITIPK